METFSPPRRKLLHVFRERDKRSASEPPPPPSPPRPSRPRTPPLPPRVTPRRHRGAPPRAGSDPSPRLPLPLSPPASVPRQWRPPRRHTTRGGGVLLFALCAAEGRRSWDVLGRLVGTWTPGRRPRAVVVMRRRGAVGRTLRVAAKCGAEAWRAHRVRRGRGGLRSVRLRRHDLEARGCAGR